MAESVNILTGTADIHRWHTETMPSIGRADWLTKPLVESGTIDHSFSRARIAPIVVGLGSRRDPLSKSGEGKTIHLKAKVDTEVLKSPPEKHFFAHTDLRDQVRTKLRDAMGKHGKKPDIHAIPGYIFPDVGGGVLFLDGILFDSDCTPANVEPAVEILGRAYDIGMICVGDVVLASTQYSPPAPDVAVPSVIRQALKPGKGGSIVPSTQGFAKATQYIRALQ